MTAAMALGGASSVFRYFFFSLLWPVLLLLLLFYGGERETVTLERQLGTRARAAWEI